MSKTFAELSPEEVLALAISIETRNAERYHDWALRFRTYDLSTSELLNELAMEEETHREFLEDYFHRHYGPEIPAMDASQVRAGKEIEGIPIDHYFVSQTATARAIIEAAVSVEVRAHRFYEQLLEDTEDAGLTALYKTLLAFEADHVKAMEARLNRCKS